MLNVKPETWNSRLEPMGPAKSAEFHVLTSPHPGLTHQESVGRVFGRVRNRTHLFLWSQPRPLADYPDPLLTLGARAGSILFVFGLSPARTLNSAVQWYMAF